MGIAGVTLAWLIAQALVALVVVPTQLLPLMREPATSAGTLSRRSRPRTRR